MRAGIQCDPRPRDLGHGAHVRGHFFEDAPRLVEETAQGIAAALGAQGATWNSPLSAPLIIMKS